ncbi:MAG: LacI family DNA-binding transcriptional regulator [Victivallales bacterium]|nr:LacI family DNA-binding transcriptional regulator [Victivallales bacterium]
MVTMKDVAQEAGVSRPTVSLVLSGRDTAVRISTSTREHILKTAERLGYRRNELATSMKTGKTNIIGFIGGIEEEYVLRIISGINDTLSEAGFLLKMFPINDDKADVKFLARQCVEQMVSGVICRALQEDDLAVIRAELEPHDISVVLVDNSFSHEWCGRVISDDATGMVEAVRHLAELGHSRVGHITHDTGSGFVALRREGFIKGMRECNLDCPPECFSYIECVNELTPKISVEFERFMREYCPTAIICATDPIAMKFLQWAYKHKIRVPDQVSVTGFADLTMSMWASPALTTVHQPFRTMGQRAAVKILEMCRDDNNGVKDELIPVTLVIRDSTGKP